ncbi:PIG-L family deacetylase [Streptomyces sp. MS2.AVA.5]|uniref:PIG-L family deacetylase n=1 Tax=Streptomyces achmelvichensis TaxID=3134111 RepID=A0ACC6Q8F4_9ACTN
MSIASPADDQRNVHVQICAHLDDDLYFMNPDLLHAMRSGDRVLSIFLSAGEADGKNAPEGSVKYNLVAQDFSAYYGARVNGSQAAYTHMGGYNMSASWNSETITLASGALVEHVFLEDAPHIGMLLFSLAKRSGAGSVTSLHRLWEERIDRQDGLLLPGSPLTSVQSFTKADLIEDLAQLLVGLRPHVVRTLNPLPERVVETSGDVASHDHLDHEASALFAHAAVDRARHQGLVTTVLTYRGYENKHWPSNLDASTLREKHLALSIYGRGRPDRPGDRKVGDLIRKRRYGDSCAVRRSTGAVSLLQNEEGSCFAFGALSTSPVMWVPGAAPTTDVEVTPHPMTGVRVMSDLAATLTPRGLEVFALRSESDDPLQRRTLDIVTAQRSPEGGFTAWQTLGNPYDRKAWFKKFGIGSPVVAVGGDDRVYVFVRNFGSGLSCRIADKDGAWGKWLDLGGAGADVDLSAVTARDGCVYVFGSTAEGLLCWSQEMCGGGFTSRALAVGGSAGPPDALCADDGSLLVAWRAAGTGEVTVMRMSSLDGRWTAPHPTGWGMGGIGRIAAIMDPHRPAVWLASRSRSGMAEFACLRSDSLDCIRRGTAELAVAGGLAWAPSREGQPLLAGVTPAGNLRFCPTGQLTQETNR